MSCLSEITPMQDETLARRWQNNAVDYLSAHLVDSVLILPVTNIRPARNSWYGVNAMMMLFSQLVSCTRKGQKLKSDLESLNIFAYKVREMIFFSSYLLSLSHSPTLVTFTFFCLNKTIRKNSLWTFANETVACWKVSLMLLSLSLFLSNRFVLT